MKLFKKAKKGFTLVELVVVIAVIAILAAVSVGAYFGVTDSANRSKLEQEAKQAYTNIQLVSLVDSKDGFDLDIDGLSIDKLGDFQREVAKAGGDYVFTDSYDAIDDEKPTIVLNTQAVSASNTQSVYKQFDYYIPTISGMHANCNILNGGKITIVKGDNPAFGDIDNSETPDAPTPEEPEHVCSFNNNGPTCDTCDKPNPNYVAPNEVTGISINGEESVTLTLLTSNIEYQIETTVSLQDNTKEPTQDYTIVYTSSNNEFATVSSTGLVEAKSTGEVTITAIVKVGDQIIDDDFITVIISKADIGVTITSTKEDFIAGVDTTYTFTANVSGNDVVDRSVTWSSDNDAVTINVKTGVATFKDTSFESALITATSNADNTKSASVEIRLDKRANEINLSTTTKTLNINEEFDVNTLVSFNSDATIDKEYTVTSSSDAIKVTNKTIKPVRYVDSDVTITVALSKTVKKELTVKIANPIGGLTIKDGDAEVTSIIELTTEQASSTKTLTAALTTNYEGATYTWTVTGPLAITGENTQTAIIEARDAGEGTVKVVASLFGAESEKTINVNITAPAVEPEEPEEVAKWVKVEDKATLKSGDKIILVTQRNSETRIFDNITSNKLSVSNSTVTLESDGSILNENVKNTSYAFTLEDAGSNYFNFKCSSGYLKGNGTASKNKADIKFADTTSDSTMWTFNSILSGGDATIKNKNDGRQLTVQYNNNTSEYRLGNYAAKQNADATYSYSSPRIFKLVREIEEVEPTPVTYTFTINPTPSNASVTLTATGFSQNDNSIVVTENTVVTYSVELEGYKPVNGAKTIVKDESFDVELEKIVVPDPNPGENPDDNTLTETTFKLGADGTATHTDGSSKSTTYSETVNGVKLNITDGTNMYPSSRDAKGNGGIKFGSSAVGSMKFVVPDDVESVAIYVGKYKANTTKVNINNKTYTISNSSNDGKYDVIIIDTSTTKTVTFTTVSGGVRAMMNTIIYNPKA